MNLEFQTRLLYETLGSQRTVTPNPYGEFLPLFTEGSDNYEGICNEFLKEATWLHRFLSIVPFELLIYIFPYNGDR